MNAQEMLLDYASKNNNHSSLTAQQFIGQAINEGVRIQDTPSGGIVIVNVRREGKTIILSETVKEDVIEGKKVTTTEIFRVNV